MPSNADAVRGTKSKRAKLVVTIPRDVVNAVQTATKAPVTKCVSTGNKRAGSNGGAKKRQAKSVKAKIESMLSSAQQSSQQSSACVSMNSLPLDQPLAPFFGYDPMDLHNQSSVEFMDHGIMEGGVGFAGGQEYYYGQTHFMHHSTAPIATGLRHHHTSSILSTGQHEMDYFEHFMGTISPAELARTSSLPPVASSGSSQLTLSQTAISSMPPPAVPMASQQQQQPGHPSTSHYTPIFPSAPNPEPDKSIPHNPILVNHGLGAAAKKALADQQAAQQAALLAAATSRLIQSGSSHILIGRLAGHSARMPKGARDSKLNVDKDSKRALHIESEHKRRSRIRNELLRLNDLVPELMGCNKNSQSKILQGAADFLERMVQENRRLRADVAALLKKQHPQHPQQPPFDQ